MNTSAGLAAYRGHVCQQVDRNAAWETLGLKFARTRRNVALITVGADWEMTTVDMDAYLDHVLLLLNYRAEMVMWDQENALIRMNAVRKTDGVEIHSTTVAQDA